MRRGHGCLEGSLCLLCCLDGLRVGPGHHIVEKGIDVTPDLGAGGILDLRSRQPGPDAFEDRDGSRRVSEDHPRTLRGLHRIGQGADHGHLTQVLVERQEPAFIPEQHHRPLRGEACFPAVLGQGDNLRQLRLIGVRLLEETHPDLYGENGPHGRLDVGQLQRAVLDESGKVLRVRATGHVHVQTRIQRAQGRLAPIAGEALDDQVPDGHRVADDKALEPPLAAQHIVKQPAVATGRDVVEVHVSAHECPDAGLHRGFKGWEVDVAQPALGQIDRIIVTPAVRRPVPGEVFGAGHDMVGRTEG